MTHKTSRQKELEELIEVRDAMEEARRSCSKEEAAELDTFLRRINSQINEAYTDAYFTGELDPAPPDDPEDNDPPGAPGPEGKTPQ